MTQVPLCIELIPASARDAHELADLRVAAMRESLERVGRFDPTRARERFMSTFAPELTHHIVAAGQRVGFIVVRPREEGLLLDHLYFWPQHQGKGYGSLALSHLFSEADASGKAIHVGALKDSRSNEFYASHGFQFANASEWDNYYVRQPGAA